MRIYNVIHNINKLNMLPVCVVQQGGLSLSHIVIR